jgi:hypothetical protein
MSSLRDAVGSGVIDGHSPDQHRPIGGYAALTGLFASSAAGFGLWFRRSGRPLPDRMGVRDLALLSVASHKLARTLAADRVTSIVRAPFTEFQDDAGPGEVHERARGRGLRRAIGELLVCPFCLSMWMSAGLTAMLLVWPRATRWFAAVWTIFFSSELLQIAYSRAESRLTE